LGINVRSNGYFEGAYPKLRLFNLNGIEEMDLGKNKNAISKRPEAWMRNLSEGEYISFIIAHLGSEGWEMVSTAPGTSIPGEWVHHMYFRRKLEE